MKNKKILGIAISALLAVALLVLFLELNGTTDFYQKPKTSTPMAEENPINYGPPTEEEQAAGDKQKEEIVRKAEENSALPDNATVAIVDANQYDQEVEIRAFATNVVADGQCIITLQQGNQTVTKTVDAFADASTTPCINLSIPRDEFKSDGEWAVTVEYRNDTIKGSSQTVLTLY